MVDDDCAPSEKPWKPLPSGWRTYCPECEGAGRITHGSPRVNYDGDECGACRGTGRVTK